MQIWHHTIPTAKDLSFCLCLDHPPRADETAICFCRQDSALAIYKPEPIKDSYHTPAALEPTPSFVLGTEELLSQLPLTCRQIYDDTYDITQPHKNLTLCSPICLTSLLAALYPNELAMLTKITIAIDLRVFRPTPSSGQLASFHDIWKCIYNTRITSDRAIRRFYADPTVERMNADIIEPALDFYPLVVTTGYPFDKQELPCRRYWSDSSKGEERVAELRRIVGNRSREGLPVPGRWRHGDMEGGMIGRNAPGGG